jgi:hypothetical protein
VPRPESARGNISSVHRHPRLHIAGITIVIVLAVVYGRKRFVTHAGLAPAGLSTLACANIVVWLVAHGWWQMPERLIR